MLTGPAPFPTPLSILNKFFQVTDTRHILSPHLLVQYFCTVHKLTSRSVRHVNSAKWLVTLNRYCIGPTLDARMRSQKVQLVSKCEPNPTITFFRSPYSRYYTYVKIIMVLMTYRAPYPFGKANLQIFQYTQNTYQHHTGK
jgi:hypothetical protein